MGGQSKKESAFALMVMLRTALSRSDEAAAQFIEGLMTSSEIEAFLKRDIVHQAVSDSLSENASFSMRKIAQQCECSEGLVERVWNAMCNEYAPSTKTPATMRIAIAKESRPQKLITNILAESGFRIEIQNERKQQGIIVDLADELAPVPCGLMGGADIPKHLRAGAYQLGLVGNDKIIEDTAAMRLGGQDPLQFSTLKRFDVNNFRMCLAIPKEDRETAQREGIDYFSGKVIATSYPATLREFFRGCSS